MGRCSVHGRSVRRCMWRWRCTRRRGRRALDEVALCIPALGGSVGNARKCEAHYGCDHYGQFIHSIPPFALSGGERANEAKHPPPTPAPETARISASARNLCLAASNVQADKILCAANCHCPVCGSTAPNIDSPRSPEHRVIIRPARPQPRHRRFSEQSSQKTSQLKSTTTLRLPSDQSPRTTERWSKPSVPACVLQKKTPAGAGARWGSSLRMLFV